MKLTNQVCYSVRTGIALAAGLLALGANAQSEAESNCSQKLALGVEVGTTGIGPVLHYTPCKHLNLAISYGYFDIDWDTKTRRSRYEGSITLSNLAATLDWHPMGNGFHISAGAVMYDHEIDITGKPRNGSLYEIGNHDYDNTQITSLTGKVDTGSEIAPYLGVGWTWHFKKSGLSLFTNAGVIFTREYDARLSATGPLANDPTFRADLRMEEEDINDGDDAYPVAKVGLAYRF